MLYYFDMDKNLKGGCKALHILLMERTKNALKRV